jgi:hypothetical protein
VPVPLKPPRGAFISSAVIYHPELKPAVKDTLIQLLGLAWRNNGVSTPALHFNQLAQLTGKPAKTLYGHLADLRGIHAALRMQDAGDGMVIFTFADWVLPARAQVRSVSEKSEKPVKEEEEFMQTSSIGENLLLHHHDQEEGRTIAHMHPKRKKALRLQVHLSTELQQVLLEAGVFPSLLPEVGATGRTDEDILALLAWVQDAQPSNPAPLFMARRRAGASAPPAFRVGACPRCGLRGRHGPECPSRYLDDPFAAFIEA